MCFCAFSIKTLIIIIYLSNSKSKTKDVFTFNVYKHTTRKRFYQYLNFVKYATREVFVIIDSI
jgi:hypothetical protein